MEPEVDVTLMNQPAQPRIFLSYRLAYGALTLAIIGFGFYAQHLNSQLYQKHAPFYDSITYYDRVYEVASIRNQTGLLAAVQNACLEKSTIVMPYLMAIPFSYFFSPTRAIGVWIEIAYFATFLFSVGYLLHRVFGARPREMLFMLVPFFLLSALYRPYAGISDLRVDLPMAFLYGASACWLFIGMLHHRWRDLFIAGLLMATACLSRAIAPVYFGIGMAPLVIHELIRSEQKFEVLKRAIFVGGIVALFSGWFYLAHYDFLYYYYFVWNTDANASVSFGRSLRHILLVAKSVGPFVAVFFLSLYMTNKSISRSEITECKTEALEWERPNLPVSPYLWFCWIGVAPVLVLIVKRADLNPFVSLPSATVLLMLWTLIQHRAFQWVIDRRLPRILWTSSICLTLAMTYGYVNHTITKLDNSAAAHRVVLNEMLRDAEKTDLQGARFSVNVMTILNTGSLQSTLRFEKTSSYAGPQTTSLNNREWIADDRFFLPAEVNWRELPGDSNKEKIDGLLDHAISEVDYIVSPTLESVPAIQAKYDYCFASRFAGDIISSFQDSPSWRPITEKVEIQDGIAVVVLKNFDPARRSRQRSGRQAAAK